MKSKIVIITLISFFSFQILHAQFNVNTHPFWQGEITLTDGTIKKGFIKVPNTSVSKKIAFKKTKDGEKEIVKRNSIASVKVISGKGNRFLYESVAIQHPKGNKVSKKKYLLLVQASNNYAKFYVMSKYKVDKKNGTITPFYRYNSTTDFPTFTYYIRKRDSEAASFFYMTGQVSGIKKGAKKHLFEDKELLKKINKKELKGKHLSEIIKTYLKTTESM